MKTNRGNNNTDLDLLDLREIQFYEQTQTRIKLDVYLDEYIESSRYYRPLFQKMINLTEDDQVMIVLNTYGGNLDGCMTIVQAIQQTDAHVQTIISGHAASAGSIIALMSPNLAVTEQGTMFIHSASTGTAGKLNEISTDVNFNKPHIERIMRDAYEGFLTEQEISELFIGRDFYFNAKQIEERLELRNIYNQEKNNPKVDIPKKRSRKTTQSV